MSTSREGAGLLGRRTECGVLDRLLDDVRGGHSRVLVLSGEAGVGKSSLLAHVRDRATGCRVARTTGVEVEMELAFAGLHQLCAPMIHRVDYLPAPQREALATAFGLSNGPAPERFLVGLAALGLLSETAAEQPLICLIDDVQWLDTASAQALAFIARRLRAEAVAMIFSVREPAAAHELTGLPRLQVSGLPGDDARALLDSVIRGRLDEQVRNRIIFETRANPLALLELARGLTSAELAGGYGVPTAQPLASRIEDSFRRRLDALPRDTRLLLLTAAAEPVGDATLLWRAAARLGIGEEVAPPATSEGLIELGARVRFRHPLVRSAVYRAASSGDRRRVHAALAEETDPAADPDRRAWHRAHATSTLDEEVAAELERSADRARARGGVAAAGAFLSRAASLTPDHDQRGARALAAAEAMFESGSNDAVLDLLLIAGDTGHDATSRARRDVLRARLAFESGRRGDAPPLLLTAATSLDAAHPALARKTYLDMLGAAIFAGRLSGSIDVARAAAVARHAAPAMDPTPLDLLLEGLARRFTDGYSAGLPVLRRALQEGRDQGSAPWMWLACPVALELWDDDAWHELATIGVQLARDAGALAFLPVALTYLAGAHLHAGEFRAASGLIEEADAIASSTGMAAPRYLAPVLAAWRGDDATALQTVEHVVDEATARGDGRAIALTEYARALLFNGLGRHDSALGAARHACDYDDLGFFGWGLVELIEAAARSDRTDEAATAVARLSERTRSAGSDWALGMEAVSRALVSEGTGADRLYCSAIESLSRTRIAVHLARTRLLYGEWLNGEDRAAEAREQLRVAHEMFAHMGAGAFAARTREALRDAGEVVRAAPDGHGELTAQEAQIAMLAGNGLTNPEIGAQLFISPRTVEWHLHKVFEKLGVGSRRELPATAAAASRTVSAVHTPSAADHLS